MVIFVVYGYALRLWFKDRAPGYGLRLTFKGKFKG